MLIVLSELFKSVLPKIPPTSAELLILELETPHAEIFISSAHWISATIPEFTYG